MGVEERLERIERLLLLGSKEVLNTSEIALLLGISESRVRHLTNAKKIPHYKQGNKVYFRKKEIEAWQLQSRVPTDDEIRSRGTTYAVTHK
ncbi:helix-turn-helix domain-containing protein [uncultured Alistipes sp.]|jgi:excisionase family DNA binding protein|uniref:helix-turn-helix domain-containing protein n=1 Tax=uncultured Alistipes sp. TaxID=538949 RepID=UPI0025F44D15|nr:helix-turn-helix domain-containing protein [uncultured Alistipes sp.]